MGKKAAKATKRYVASGRLKNEIKSRKKYQQIKRTFEKRRSAAKTSGIEQYRRGKQNANGKDPKHSENDEDVLESSLESYKETGKGKDITVEQILNADFMDDSEAGSVEEEGEDEDGGDNASFASVDDLEGEAAEHKLDLAKLAEQDPGFYKYLQENDQELLNFDANDEEDEEDEEMDDERMDVDEGETAKAPPLTLEILRRWQKAILEHRSLRALRRLLIAFRAAAYHNEEEQTFAWSIGNPAVYEKLVTTTLRYTPMVLDHHVPYKMLPNNKFKPPVQSPKLATLTKLILSFFYNVIHLIEQSSASDIIELAITESAKLIPYIIGCRKAVKVHLKTCLKFWSSAEDSIRIASYLAIRKLASSSDEGIKDMMMKNTYLTLLRNAKQTSVHTLPSINLMKNTAAELFCADHGAAYQHAFMYIRQLAVHLRSSMKVKSKESFKQVYNWQYAHCVDFWSIVLAKACDMQAQYERESQESELKALVYPLTQVALGAIKLISSPRSYPFHLQIAQSLIHLAQHTATYIPLIPYILPIITATLAPSSRPKSSTLRPLDLETHIRAPSQYQKTRIYSIGVLEEAVFLLTEWLSAPHVQASIAFPEIVVPLIATLKKKTKKGAAGGKEAGAVRVLLEKVDEHSKWIAERRKAVAFGPKNVEGVRAWEKDVNAEETPLGKYVKLQKKLREKRKKMLEKAREGEEAYLED